MAHIAAVYVLLTLSMSVCIMIVLAKDRVYYADFERSNVTYWNPKYYAFLNLSAQRYGRKDPMHYVNAHYRTLVQIGNEITINVYIYEFLSNEYRRSFVEMHYRVCDFVLADKIFGSIFTVAMPEHLRKCPFPQAEYHLVNLSYPDLPLLKTFPFQKGRVFVDFTVAKTKERVVEFYIDLAIKSKWR